MIVEMLAKWWGVKNSLPREVNLIAMVSYGTKSNVLTRGSANIIVLTEKLRQKYPSVLIAFGVFTFSSCSRFEKKVKIHQFPNAIFAGLVESTIEEAQKIREVVDHQPKMIVVVTGECHSRTARLVWETYFPNSEILVCTCPVTDEVDSSNPMIFARYKWTWLVVNVIRHIVFKVIGVTRMERFKLRQPTSI